MSNRRVVFMSPKAPDDIAHVPGIDFRATLTLPAETIAAVDVSVVITERATGEDLTATMLVAGSVGVSAGGVVSFRVQAGSDNHDYLARVRAQTSTARIERGQVIIPVRIRGQR